MLYNRSLLSLSCRVMAEPAEKKVPDIPSDYNPSGCFQGGMRLWPAPDVSKMRISECGCICECGCDTEYCLRKPGQDPVIVRIIRGLRISRCGCICECECDMSVCRNKDKALDCRYVPCPPNCKNCKHPGKSMIIGYNAAPMVNNFNYS